MIAAFAHAGFTGDDLVLFPEEASPRIRESALYREAGADRLAQALAAKDSDILGPLVTGPAANGAWDEVLLDPDQAVLLCALLGTARAVVVAERLMPLLPLSSAA